MISERLVLDTGALMNTIKESGPILRFRFAFSPSLLVAGCVMS